MAASDTNCPNPTTARLDLLLSGGGYRATLFHIGVLRFLYEYSRTADGPPLLATVRHLVAVSGGSITAAHYGLKRREYCASFSAPAMELITFTKTVDIRRQLLVNNVSVGKSLQDLLGERKTFASVDENVNLAILGTSLRTGGCVEFSRRGIAHYVNSTEGERRLAAQGTILSQNVLLAQAITASAAFPPFLPPLAIGKATFSEKLRTAELGDLWGHEIGDGGIRDNLGTEYYSAARATDLDTSTMCLVSDAGRVFDWDRSSFQEQSLRSWGGRLLRTIDIQMNRQYGLDVAGIDPRTHISLSDARGLASIAKTDATPFAQGLTSLVAAKIAETPTDLTPFNGAEVYALVRLGYDLTHMRLHDAGFVLRQNVPDNDFWQKLFPANLKTLDGAGDATSLENSIRGAVVQMFLGADDLVAHFPAPTWIKILLHGAFHIHRHRRTLVVGVVLSIIVALVGAVWVIQRGGIGLPHHGISMLPDGEPSSESGDADAPIDPKYFPDSAGIPIRPSREDLLKPPMIQNPAEIVILYRTDATVKCTLLVFDWSGSADAGNDDAPRGRWMTWAIDRGERYFNRFQAGSGWYSFYLKRGETVEFVGTWNLYMATDNYLFVLTEPSGVAGAGARDAGPMGLFGRK